MIKAVLIDDEVRATDSLRLLIERFIPEIDKVWVCNDATRATQLIHRFRPDLVFLDIRMPHLSGFDVLERIPNKCFRVIFTTAFDEYAIKAIRFSAFDYLLKPIDAEELASTVKRFLESRDDYTSQQELFGNIRYNMELGKQHLFRLAVPTKAGVRFLMPHDIIRCEASSNYTVFHVACDRQYMASKTLGEYEELLGPHHFIRTHKSHLVNKNFISFIDHDGFAILQDNTRVEISRRRKTAVLAALQ